jgi:hypothetical protein
VNLAHTPIEYLFKKILILSSGLHQGYSKWSLPFNYRIVYLTLGFIPNKFFLICSYDLFQNTEIALFSNINITEKEM